MKTLSFKIRKITKENYKIIKDFSHYSNNLYNYSLYVTKKYFEETNQYIGLNELDKEVRNNENYKLLPAQTSQQIIRLVDKNFRSYFALLRKKSLGQYHEEVHIPKFKKKGNCFNLIFTFQNSKIIDNKMKFCLSNTYKKENKLKSGNFSIPFTYDLEGKLKQIIIKPINNSKFFYCYIQYEENKKEVDKLSKENYLSIDLGLDNLGTCFDSKSGHSFILNGKPLKSYNRFWNKTVSEVKSELKLKSNKNWSNKLSNLNEKRNFFIQNYFNQYVSYLVKYCIEKDIGNLVIGYNETWKKEINLGKVNNQKFSYIPFWLFKRKLESKCNEFGIKFIQINESYTSLCSALDLEPIQKHESYLGKRIKRGLFKTNLGKLVNADVNGSVNILRKVIGDDLFSKQIQPILGLMFNPVKINFLQTKVLNFVN